MSIWNYKYGGFSVRQRWDAMVGTHAGPIEWCVRLALIAFMLRTMADPTESIYISPIHWVGILWFIFFYL